MPTTSTTVTETIRTEAIGAAALYYSAQPGIRQFVTVADISGQATNTYQFPIIDSINAAAVAENADFSTLSTVDTSGSASATVTEHAVMSRVTDYAADSSQENLIGGATAAQITAAGAEGATVGRMHAEALQRLQDTDITALFESFNSSTGSDSGAMTTTLISDGVTILNENNIPRDRRVIALHPSQFGDIIPSMDDASTFGRQGQELLTTGAVGGIYGATIFQTTNIGTATVSMNTVHAGAIMHPDAVGLVVKGGTVFETERDASLRSTEVIGVEKHGETEYRGGATTSGRGGAGVFLYSQQ